MGQEVTNEIFDYESEKVFSQRLKEETEIFKSWIKSSKKFSKGKAKCGYELEAWLIDDKGRPVSKSVEFLKKLNNKQVTPELSKFNFEINGTPYLLKDDYVKNLKKDIHGFFNKCNNTAYIHKSNVLLIGTYPDFSDEEMSEKNFTPSNRYKVLNQRIQDLRKGPAKVNIKGKDSLEMNLENILFECQATSLQIHLQVHLNEAKDFYNASVLSSPFMAALCANSPFAFGKELWHESRVPIFEQSISLGVNGETGGAPRVGLGHNFVEKCISELFDFNLKYPILLPELMNDDSEKLKHLKFHNGTIWRWNRPLIDFSKSKVPHIRIEHRVPSAGPSIKDVKANILFFVGLVHAFKNILKDKKSIIDFDTNKKNFYQAAKFGLNAKIEWLDGEMINIGDYIAQNLVELVIQELVLLGNDKQEVESLVGNVIRKRAETKQNGSQWQINYINKHGRNFNKMIEEYIRLQNKNLPVYLWPL